MDNASGEERSPEQESRLHSPDAPAKKKKAFQPLKSLKKLFTGRKRTKSKDEPTQRTRSAESVLQPDEAGKSHLSKGLSMSDDSVFNPKEGTSSDATRSTENLSRNKDFKGDHSIDSDSDMDPDAENNFFRPMASGSSLKINNQSDVDLDAIPQGSTSNLAHPSAYHKMAVKPRKQGRPGGRSTKTARSPTPTSPTQTSTKVLPQLKEEIPAPAGDETPDEDYDVESSNDELEKEPEPEIPKPAAIPPDVKEETKQEEKESDETPDKKKVEIAEEVVIIKKTSPVKPATAETKEPAKETSGVVMRQKSGASTDSSKRQTLPAPLETEKTVFGERKKRSSVIMDGKNWDDLEKQKENKGEPETEGSSEFAKMFNKFQRKTVKKEVKEESGEVEKKEVGVRLKPVKALGPSSVENTDTTQKKAAPPGNKPTLSPKPKPIEPEKKPPPKQALVIEKSVTLSTKDVIEKSSSVQKSDSFRSKPVDKQQPTPKPDEQKPESKLPEKEKSPPKPVVKSDVKEEKVSESKEPKPTKTVTIQKSFAPARDKSDADTAKTKVDNESSSSFKRDSPLVKNRARSQTLPDNPGVVKEKEAPVSSSPSVKRTASSVNPGKSDSPRVKPRQPEAAKPSAAAGGGPSWLAMAKKKTAGWSEDRDKEIETKKDEKEASPAPEATKSQTDSCSEEMKGSHRKSVMDIAKRFQNLQVS